MCIRYLKLIHLQPPYQFLYEQLIILCASIEISFQNTKIKIHLYCNECNVTIKFNLVQEKIKPLFEIALQITLPV